MNPVGLLDGQTEADLRATVRDFLADRCAPSAVARIYDGDRAVVGALWKAIVGELGIGALLVPDRLGGAGGTARDAAVVLEELGRAVAPVPFFTSSVVATATLLAVGDASADPLLGELAAGESTAALTVPFSAGDSSQVTLATSSSGRLVGRITTVAGALEADALLVPVQGAAGIEIHRVRAGDATIAAVASLDMSRQLADVTLDGAVSTPVSGGDAEGALDHALMTSAALLASEQLGLADWCLTTTVDYLKQRRQFGRTVGSFQALKHRMADMYAAVELARSVARYAAAVAGADDPDLPVAAAVGQVWCGDTAVRCAEEAIQLHGGIGMTWEHPAHLYLKRAKADQLALGGPALPRQRLADVLDLAGPAV